MPGEGRRAERSRSRNKGKKGAERAKPALAPIVTLTTDFGTDDYFVGSVKGVLLGYRPDLQIIDITHQVPPHDIVSAAFIIKEAYRYFPLESVHLVVVDPGVGTDRKKIIVSHRSHTFVAPDNGVLTYITRMAGSAVYEVRDTPFFQFKTSPTFAGRDHFAPLAAFLAQGDAPEKFGKKTDDYCRLEALFPEERSGRYAGKIVYIDRFGNAITNFTERELERTASREKAAIQIKGHRLTGLKRNYAEGEPGRGNLIVNSSGHIEIFVPAQSARSALKLSLLDDVTLERI